MSVAKGVFCIKKCFLPVGVGWGETLTQRRTIYLRLAHLGARSYRGEVALDRRRFFTGERLQQKMAFFFGGCEAFRRTMLR